MHYDAKNEKFKLFFIINFASSSTFSTLIHENMKHKFNKQNRLWKKC